MKHENRLENNSLDLWYDVANTFHVLHVQVVAMVCEKIGAQGSRLDCYLGVLILVDVFMY